MDYEITITPVTPETCDTCWELIDDLAKHQARRHELELTPAQLHNALFGSTQRAHAAIAYVHSCSTSDPGFPVGMALYYFTFPSFTGRPALFIEDLFVNPTFRRMGIGASLLGFLSDTAQAQACCRLEWWSHAHNAEARDFYQHMGATHHPELIVHRLDHTLGSTPSSQLCAAHDASAAAESQGHQSCSGPFVR